MRVYVINLANATDRLAHMEHILGEAGIRFERFDAIDAGRAIAHPCFKRIPPMLERGWTASELGCLLSHYEIWCRIAAGADPFGAVMEDDLFVDPNLKSLLEGEIRFPRDADLIKLETTVGETSISRLARYRSNAFRFHSLRSLHYGSGAYLVSRAAAKKLVGLIESFDTPIDDALFSPTHAVGSQVKVYQLVPALAIQNVKLADAFQRPELGTRMERERAMARELEQAMAHTKAMTPSKKRAREVVPAHRALLSALVRRFNSAKSIVFEKKLVIPFALDTPLAEMPRTSCPSDR